MKNKVGCPVLVSAFFAETGRGLVSQRDPDQVEGTRLSVAFYVDVDRAVESALRMPGAPLLAKNAGRMRGQTGLALLFGWEPLAIF